MVDDYSKENVATGNANDQFFIKLRDIVQKELHLPYDKVVHLMYPDYFYGIKAGSKKLIIVIENSVEK